MKCIEVIDETYDSATFLLLGELQVKKVIPIDQACAKCSHPWITSISECQAQQREDARARGFKEIVCPRQFED